MAVLVGEKYANIAAIKSQDCLFALLMAVKMTLVTRLCKLCYDIHLCGGA